MTLDLSHWPIKLKDSSLVKTQALVNGRWCDAIDSAQFDVENPANGECIALVARCSTQDAILAVESAHEALAAWRETPAKERASIIHKWYQLVIENEEDLSRILSLEQGKVLAEAKAEVRYGASYLEWFAEEAKRICGDVIAAPANDKRILTIKAPVGVVSCITPWNFPNAMLARKIAPALAAGCTVVCKPANETPLSAFALGELAIRAGVPEGVINILCGQTEHIGEVLTTHPLVRKVSFTGSTQVGQKLLKQCADTVKRTSMELGGNAPFIVFDDADLEKAIEGARAAKLRNSGQTCISPNRFLVQRGIYQAFVEKLSAAFSACTVGPGYQENIDCGPMISERAVQKVTGLIKDALKNGAQLECGSAEPLSSEDSQLFLSPTVLSQVNDTMAIFHNEIFGPVASIIPFDTEQEAIALANNTPYGLAAYVFTHQYQRIWHLGEALEFGMIGMNNAVISNEAMPFGGIKASGHGREGSKYGLDDYLDIKTLSLGL